MYRSLGFTESILITPSELRLYVRKDFSKHIIAALAHTRRVLGILIDEPLRRDGVIDTLPVNIDKNLRISPEDGMLFLEVIASYCSGRVSFTLGRLVPMTWLHLSRRYTKTLFNRFNMSTSSPQNKRIGRLRII